MVPLTEYLADRTPTIVFSFISEMISFGLISSVILAFFKINVKGFRFWCGIFLMGALHLTPLYTIHYLFYFPGAIEPFWETFLMFPTPIMLILIYPILRRIYQYSVSQSVLLFEFIVLSQYLVLLIYMTMSNIWEYWINPVNLFPVQLNVSLAAMFTVWPILVAFMIAFRIMSSKLHLAINIPYDFPIGSFRKTFVKNMISITVTYAILVSLCILIMDQRHFKLNAERAIFFFILFVILMNKLTESFKGLKLRIKDWNARETAEYINTLVNTNNQFRQMKHDWSNIIQVYGGYIGLDEIEGLRKYHESLTMTINKSSKSLELIECLRSRTAIYTLLENKNLYAEKMGVNFLIDKIDSIVRIEMNDLDLCRILGNLIDNAIEAAAMSKEKELSIESSETGPIVTIIIKNSLANPVDIKEIFKSGFSTKENHSGEGLSSISGILSHNENCSLNIALENNRFMATICFPAEQKPLEMRYDSMVF